MADVIMLREQRIEDAVRFYEIMADPAFKFSHKPKSLCDEIKFLLGNTEKREKKEEFNYAILYNEILVGGCGVKIVKHDQGVGLVGYFVDRNYWNKGIATKAVQLLEAIAFRDIGLERLEIGPLVNNLASQMVAIKCGFTNEGRIENALWLDGRLVDVYCYAKHS